MFRSFLGNSRRLYYFCLEEEEEEEEGEIMGEVERGVGLVMNMSLRHRTRPLMSNSAALGEIKYCRIVHLFRPKLGSM